MALKWINTAAFAAMVAVNALANLLPIGGNTTGQVSEAYPNLFTPAPITFAIWGLIYLMMAVFIIYQWEVFDGGRYSANVREDIGLWFAVSCALNIAWIFLWHYRLIELSVICIQFLLISLILIRGRLGHADGSLPLRMAAKAGFSIYFGWTIAALLANISVMMAKAEWNGWGIPEDFRVIVMLLIGAVITSAIVLFDEDFLVGIAVMWAYTGILIRHISPAYYGGTHPFVIFGAFLGEAVILIVVLMPLFRRFITGKRYIPQQ